MNQAFVLILYLSALQGFFLSFILIRNSQKFGFQGRALGFFLLLISLSLIGRNVFFSENLDILDWKLLYLGDQIIFLFGPVSYFIFHSRLKKGEVINGLYYHLIPAVLFFLLVLPYLLEVGVDFIDIANNWPLRSGLIEGLAILSLGIYSYLNFNLLSTAQKSSFQKPKFIFEKYFLAVSLICLISWIGGFTFRNFFPEVYRGFVLYQIISSNYRLQPRPSGWTSAGHRGC